MPPQLVVSLQAHRADLRARWEAKLRALPPCSALAAPDALVHLMDWTLDRVFAEIAHPPAHHQRQSSVEADCPCGLNPLLAYFVTAEDALLELFFLGGRNSLGIADNELETAIGLARDALHRVARQELEAFCAVCRHRLQRENEAVALAR